jgi:RimJ/RimL family protein N-acetyltransferase
VLNAARYTAFEILRSGLQVEIRSLRPNDRSAIETAIEQTSAQSLYRRFFAPKRHFTEQEASFFLDVDFTSHVALVAVAKEDDQPIIAGGGRYVLLKPGQAEVAFAVIDAYQGQGIGAALMRHLTAIAREAGLHEFVAEVLPENLAMLTVFEKCGLPLHRTSDAHSVHIVLRLS